jgi:sugar/nucleoside kinase (ribokinase family)
MGALSGFGTKRSLEIATAASAIAVTRPGAADSIPARETLKL